MVKNNIKLQLEEKTGIRIQRGMLFKSPDNVLFIVADTGDGKISLISLQDGNRWSDNNTTYEGVKEVIERVGMVRVTKSFEVTPEL